jgi:ferredoxin
VSRVVLAAARCTGHGRCAALAPDVFDLDDEGRSIVLHDEVHGEHEVHARLAIDNCPERALSLENTG